LIERGLAALTTQGDDGLPRILATGVASEGDDDDSGQIAISRIIAHDDSRSGFRISLPTEGSNSTHQISPRFIAHVLCKLVAPFLGLKLAVFVLRLGAIAVIQSGVKNVWAK
jgi:hypothetical protein